MYNQPCSEYDLLINDQRDFIKEHRIDEISVQSLFKATIDFVENEPEAASVVYISPDDFSKAKSTKISNVRINLKFAIDMIFAVNLVLTSDGMWLLLSLLKAIVFLYDSMTTKLEKDEAIVLFAIYRLQKADSSRIKEYLDSLATSNKSGDFKVANVDESLQKLKKINTIDTVDGMWYITELIVVKK
ncbi:MAG: hypothetical protein K5754_14505 [Butyrivibrio sp.]|nr:hypothetical protein [Butyrivibrio sp.]